MLKNFMMQKLRRWCGHILADGEFRQWPPEAGPSRGGSKKKLERKKMGYVTG
jgi:hypothetical protein